MGGWEHHVVFVSRVASPPLLVTEAQCPPEKHLYFILMLFDTRDKQCWHRARAIVKLPGMVVWPIPGNVNSVSELSPIHLWKTFSPKWKCWADGHEAWSSWNIFSKVLPSKWNPSKKGRIGDWGRPSSNDITEFLDLVLFLDYCTHLSYYIFTFFISFLGA